MEVAKLGIEVNADSAVSARAKLLDLANAGNVIGQTLRDMTRVILEQTGATKNLASAHDRLISASKASLTKSSAGPAVDLDREAQALNNLDAAARRVANARLDARLKEVADAAKTATPVLNGLDNSTKSVAKSAAAGAVGMLDLGSAGNAASNALQAVLTSSGPMALAMGAVALAVGFVNYRIDEQRKKLEQLAEQGLQKIQRETEDLKLDQSIRAQIKSLEALDPELENIRQKYEQLRIQQGKTADADTLARISRAQALETNKLLNARQEASAKEQDGIRQQIASLEIEKATIGATADEVARLNTQQKINAIAADDMAKKHGALTNELIKETAAVGALQRAQQLINSGQGAAAQAEQQFGVSLAVNRDKGAVSLAQQFIPMFRAAGNDPTLRAEAQQMFSSLVQQLSASGTQNISGLLGSLGLSSRDIAELRAGLGTVTTGYSEKLEEVKVQQRNVFSNLETIGTTIQSTMVPQVVNVRDLLDQSDQKTKSWTDSMVRTVEQYGQIGRAGSEVEAMLGRITRLVQQKLSLDIDVSPAVNSLAELEQRYNGIAGKIGASNGSGASQGTRAYTDAAGVTHYSNIPGAAVDDYDNTVRSATGIDNNTRVTS